MAKKKFLYYVVRKGYNPGIYRSWEECNNQVSGFHGNEYKGFSTLCEAEAYFNKSGLGNCGIEVGADKKLLEENKYKKFSDSVFTGETTKVKRSTCGNSPLVESTPLKASPDFKTEAEDCSEYFSLESLCNEPSDQERHYIKFSSFSRMCDLLCNNLEYARNITDIHEPMFLLFEGRKCLKRDECQSESDDDDNGLLHFDSESHLFNYLGLEKVKTSSTVVADRYFHELQNYFSDKYVMDLTKEAEDLMNTFKLFLVKHEVVACISASSLANSAVSLPDGCWKKVNENGKEGIF